MENNCREGTTSWIEIISDKNISQVSIKEQMLVNFCFFAKYLVCLIVLQTVNFFTKYANFCKFKFFILSETIQTMLTTIKNQLKEFDYPEINEFRLYEYQYLKRHRIILKTILEGDFDYTDSNLENLMVLVLNLSCGELTDFANEYINMIADTNPLFQVKFIFDIIDYFMIILIK